MKLEKLLPLNLQFFAEEDTDNQDNNDNQDNQENQNQNEDKNQNGKTYSEEEVQKMVKDRVAREKKAAEKAIDEAKKLAKMNEDEKAKYELEKLQKKLAEYERKESFYSLSKEASKMLSENAISVDDDLLAFVVKETAEDTQAAVNSFVTLINAKVEEGVKKALKGTSPKVTTNNKAMTKQEILAEKDTTKRLKLIEENPQLFNNWRN
ncbi:DUF4355 domain-containing protein [Niallia taxi]|uniref:DUF4355 domain-containing protein n=1 Tax=Niallia taxi TaxID=2499688 RepID=UPI002934B72A|nr:DUF4355 domain-containing protein [Niallia taxi]WOD61768.1 DUF4355 domain-containing protein [Niallia taxi]